MSGKFFKIFRPASFHKDIYSAPVIPLESHFMQFADKKACQPDSCSGDKIDMDLMPFYFFRQTFYYLYAELSLSAGAADGKSESERPFCLFAGADNIAKMAPQNFFIARTEKAIRVKIAKSLQDVFFNNFAFRAADQFFRKGKSG